jgi:hypothetical protein
MADNTDLDRGLIATKFSSQQRSAHPIHIFPLHSFGLCIMSGHEHSSAGSQYTYDMIEDLDYETFNATDPSLRYMQHQLDSCIDHEQSPIGT